MIIIWGFYCLENIFNISENFEQQLFYKFFSDTIMVAVGDF
jgi:hypothetical protein